MPGLEGIQSGGGYELAGTEVRFVCESPVTDECGSSQGYDFCVRNTIQELYEKDQTWQLLAAAAAAQDPQQQGGGGSDKSDTPLIAGLVAGGSLMGRIDRTLPVGKRWANGTSLLRSLFTLDQVAHRCYLSVGALVSTLSSSCMPVPVLGTYCLHPAPHPLQSLVFGALPPRPRRRTAAACACRCSIVDLAAEAARRPRQSCRGGGGR